MKQKIYKVLMFCALLGVVLLQLNQLLSFKYPDGVRQMEQFYELEKESVDILVLGSSHAFVNVNPAVLYEEEGIAAYDLCASMQPMWHTYYYLKEALKYQKTKLIVLDVFRFVEKKDDSSESMLVKSTFGMRPSKEKWESICAGLQEEHKKEAYIYMLEFPVYHSRYVELTKEDFCYDSVLSEDYKGFYPVFGIQKMTRPDVDHVTECAPIEEKTRKYFEMILELAKQEEIPVLLINFPYIINERDKAVYNSLELLLKEFQNQYEVVYKDFNKEYDAIGLDFSSDYADYDHLNQKGAQKFNAYLADYIKKNYAIPDRRKGQ